MKKHKLYILYTCTKQKLEPKCWYDTKGNDMYFLKNKTENIYVRIPWENPTQRDIKAFIKGYSFGKEKTIEFEYTEEEW